jgi:hypothetical protein
VVRADMVEDDFVRSGIDEGPLLDFGGSHRERGWCGR